MYCATCGNELEEVTDEQLLSEDLWGGDYYTHYCSVCPAYGHLHVHGGNVDLISTKSDQVASKRIVEDLAIELGKRITQLASE